MCFMVSTIFNVFNLFKLSLTPHYIPTASLITSLKGLLTVKKMHPKSDIKNVSARKSICLIVLKL